MLNSVAAKRIDLSAFLIKLHAVFDRAYGDTIWFYSPLRDDGKKSSFKISKEKNVWHDKVLGSGGTIIDLIMELENIRDVETALMRIDEIWNENVPFTPEQREVFQEVKDSKGNKSVTEIKKVVALNNKALIDYLESRKLSFSLAKEYLEEIYYSVDNGEKKYNFFALAFKNRSGGYDVRNAYSKNCIGKKDISIIKGSDSTKLSVFEGSLSFISMLIILKISKMSGDVIIMNTVHMKKQTVEYIKDNNYKYVYGFLDNDQEGDSTTEYLYLHTRETFKDARKLFTGFKDPNDLLTNTPLFPKT